VTIDQVEGIAIHASRTKRARATCIQRVHPPAAHQRRHGAKGARAVRFLCRGVMQQARNQHAVSASTPRRVISAPPDERARGE
jgi:hypothetical protein